MSKRPWLTIPILVLGYSAVGAADFGNGSIGVTMRGADTSGDDAFFDDLEIKGIGPAFPALPDPIPEPSTLVLFAFGVVGAMWVRRRRA